MDSFTKYKLDGWQQELLVRAAFAEELSIVSSTELTGGFFNTAYDLELSDGRSVILKVAPAEEMQILSYEKDIMRAEVEALRLVSGHGGVPVPEVYHFDESRSLIPCPYFFMEKVAGQPYSEVKAGYSDEEQAVVEQELGRYQRLINGITGTRFGLFAEPAGAVAASWRETFKALMYNLLEDARSLNAALPAPEAEIKRILELYLPALDEVTEPRLIHWDLWNGNLFVHGGRIVSIIDWERALWGDVLLEYYFRHFENSPAFLQGYGQSFDRPEELLRIKLYDLYLDLILVIECYSRQYKDENHLRWAADNLEMAWKSFSNYGESIA